MNKTRLRLLAVTLIASVMALAGLVLAPSLAFAGSNGQQVAVCNKTSDPYITVTDIRGTNQNGDMVTTGGSLAQLAPFSLGNQFHASVLQQCYGYKSHT